MKTLTLILTSVVLLTSCHQQNQTYNCESQLTSTGEPGRVCNLVTKRISNKQKFNSKGTIRILDIKINAN